MPASLADERGVFTATVKGVRSEAARLLPWRIWFGKATKGELRWVNDDDEYR